MDLNILKVVKTALDEGNGKLARKLIPSLNKSELRECLRYSTWVRERDPVSASTTCITNIKDGGVRIYIKGLFQERTSVRYKGEMAFNLVKTFKDSIVIIFHKEETFNKEDMRQALEKIMDDAVSMNNYKEVM